MASANLRWTPDNNPPMCFPIVERRLHSRFELLSRKLVFPSRGLPGIDSCWCMMATQTPAMVMAGMSFEVVAIDCRVVIFASKLLRKGSGRSGRFIELCGRRMGRTSICWEQ